MQKHFDPDTLRDHIPEVDFSVHTPLAPALLDYSKYYGLNFEDQNQSIRHSLGYFQVLGGKVVAHHYSQPSAQGTVFLFHGYYDHAGLYTQLISHTLKMGFNAVIYDLPGHGLSSGPRASIDDFEDYLESLSICLQLATGKLPYPWHAIAQSTGAAILMDYLLSLPESHIENPFEESILLAPLFHPLNWKKNRIIFHLSRFFTRMVKREFVPNSHDEDFVDFIRHRDPMQSPHLKVAWVGALNKWIKKMERHQASDYSPCIIQGTADGTVDAKTNIAFIRQKFHQPEIHYVQGARHHLANESEPFRNKVFSCISHKLLKQK